MAPTHSQMQIARKIRVDAGIAVLINHLRQAGFNARLGCRENMPGLACNKRLLGGFERQTNTHEKIRGRDCDL